MAIKEQYFDDRFSAGSTMHPPLPFFHTCEAAHIQSILDSLQLIPRSCDVYREDLLYLFYGKPAYKSNQLQNSRLTSFMPMCFIINNDAVSTMKRIVAFDSGAFPKMEAHIHQSMTTKEFELKPEKDSLNKMVDFFYDGNDFYFDGLPKKDITYDPVHMQLESYLSLVNSNHLDHLDDRRAAIEVQLTSPIILNNTNIAAIILPEMLAESKTVKSILTDTLHIPMISVKNYGVSAQKYYTEMLGKARELMVSKKLLNGC